MRRLIPCTPCLGTSPSITCEYVTLQDRRDIADAIKVTYFIWEFLTLAQISKEFSNVFILKKSAYKCTRLQDQGSTVPHSQVSVQRGNLLTKETSYQKKHSCFCFLIIYCTQDD
ncbi:uncharacterized protein LOC123635533 isoform X6 [Lemur catta]|uniref:uncharacterized protein LOC123635533 isoform X6 n=1 Tax=Lemur catta TaxID=9447 RepID=UPI001E268079|nr:uncharacterized protein LOC123635533 isoform X6 [Lemur catta]